MPIMIARRMALGGAGAAMLALALAPRGAVAQAAAAAPRNAFERDRQAILSMAGAFHVRFDSRETVPFLQDYEPRDPSVSAGNEVVRVVEDAGTTIRLQHILVVSAEGRDIVVRHWRHDWHYEPRDVLAYAGADIWRIEPVGRTARRGNWSQIVYNTDHSPRYGALGAWAHDHGVSRWTSARCLRPLALRDASRNPPYTHYSCVNRHAITPTGWVHEQDNAKLGMRAGAPATFVHEAVINSYDRAEDFRVSAADSYLAATQPYWNAVRALWEDKIGAFGGLRLREVARTGPAAGPRLSQLAEQMQSGEITLDAAVTQAREFIAGAVQRP